VTAHADVVIVGSGPIGAVIARQVSARAPGASIVVVEAGGELGAAPGRHLLGETDFVVRQTYETLMRRARQAAYVTESAAQRTPQSASPTGIAPAVDLGHDFAEFPGASAAINIGGMGVHWTTLCPWPYRGEVPLGLPAAWPHELDTARALLRVTADPFAGNPFAEPVLAALRAEMATDAPGRAAQPLPMAGERAAERLIRTGPREIFPALFDGSGPSLLTRQLCTRVVGERGIVRGVVLRSLDDGEESEISAATVVVAGDALRTPQLLWASGIRPAALGTHLNEHSSLDGVIRVDAGRLGLREEDAATPIPGEPFVGAYWVPSIVPERPMHGQLLESNAPERGHVMSSAWYVRTEIDPSNRIEFSDAATDAFGMPHMTARFAYSDGDLDTIEQARAAQRRVADRLGEFVDEPELLPPGASLHYTGTARMGADDDGTSVCDRRGEVWGASGLFVGGNAVIPTALTCNSTLTAAALAVRTAAAIVERMRRA
jgi:choline dehydrogenase-like flavoprotein